MSFDSILPFLRPIAHLIEDADVSEIMVNGSRRVFVERDGVVREASDVRLDERNLRVAVKNIARALGDDVSEEKPILDSRLPDGSRVAAVLSPCSLGGTTLTIRKFQTRFFTADELVRIGTMTPEVLSAVREAIARNENILISGGTSTGKTTLRTRWRRSCRATTALCSSRTQRNSRSTGRTWCGSRRAASRSDCRP
jgi:pilus assembly protein CpaF